MKPKITKWNLLILFFLAVNHLNLAAEAYDTSASVFRFQKTMAQRGNTESQFKLGLMYETGSGAKQNALTAQSWYKKAAKQNYKPAINRLTYLEIKKSGFKSNHQQWLKDLQKDARFNEGEALFLLGQMYSEGTGVHKSLTRALELLRNAAGGNIPGSEAEIVRVEQELAQLQKQYITSQDKKNITPVVILPARKAVKTGPATVAKPRISHFRKPAGRSPLKPVKTKKASARNTRKQAPVKSQVAAKTAVKAPPKTSPPPLQPKKEALHPMDIICGGSNRFSRNCR